MSPDIKSRLDAYTLLAKIAGIENQFFRNQLVFEYFLIIVDIVNEAIKCAQALLQACTGVVPFFGGNNSRNDIERPFSIDIAGIAVHRE